MISRFIDFLNGSMKGKLYTQKFDNFINNQITICLFGIGEGSNGYLLGNSKESTDDNIPIVYLDYKGIDPNFYIGYIIAYLVIFAVLGLYLKYY